MPDERELSDLHHRLIRALVERGAAPNNVELAAQMGLRVAEVERLLQALAAIHGLVLQPHVCEPWIIHPFSLTPTIHWIEDRRASWWAPCIWCALGVAVLVGGEVRIHTRFGAEGETLVIPVRDGKPTGNADIRVHFAIPPARAWDNVHKHCSQVLPFHSDKEIDDWCARHRLERGESVPLSQVAQLARGWYGSHANANWRKWTVAEAQEIFRAAGLCSDFWELGERTGKF